MKKKNEKIAIREASSTKNTLRIKDNTIELYPNNDEGIKVKLYNHEGILAERHDQLKRERDSNSAEITLVFVSKKDRDSVNEKEEVEYYLVGGKPKNDEERQKLEKQAHENYLIDHSLINKIHTQGDIIWKITQFNGKVILEVNKKDDTTIGTIQIEGDKLKILAKFYLVDEVELKNMLNYPPTRRKKTPWTTGWIIFYVFLAAVLVLIAIFWKKIWRWIKGERAQEKKVREQIDIF